MTPTADLMEVNYELTPDDLYAFQMRAVQKSPIVKRSRRNTYDASRVSLGFFLGFFALVASLTWFFERRMTRRGILDLIKEEKPDKGQLGRHNVKLDEAGLVESTAVGEARTLWGGVDRIEEDSDYIYIYTAAVAAFRVARVSQTPIREELMPSFVRGAVLSWSALIGILLTTGCVYTRVTVFDQGSADRRTPVERIRFYDTQLPTCPYRELGHVTAESGYFPASWNKVVRTAREKAHKMGGDAIVSVRERSRVDGAILSPQQVSLTESESIAGTVIRFTNPACRQ